MSRQATRRPLVWLLATVLAAMLLVAPAGPEVRADSAAPPPGCPAPLPLDEVTPGMRGTGRTVVRGTAVSTFEVTVIDVLRDAIAPGYPLIVVETDSPEIRRVGGIWGGMSGSPIMVGDRLLGAVSYFMGSASPLAGVTPAGALYQVASGGGAAAAGPAIVAVPQAVQDLAAADGLPRSQAARMMPLPLPVAVSGPTGASFDTFAAALEGAYPHLRAVQGAGAARAGAAPVPIQPGSNLGVSLVVGDVMAMGFGTATAVCDPWVFGFGHPLVYDGEVDLGLHGGSAVTVVGDPTWSSYKLVNPGPVAGRIEQDRLAGVAGRLGDGPAGTTITSTITNADGGRRVTGRSDAYLPDQVDWIAQSHVAVNYEVKAFDDPTISGTAEARFVVRGTRADGRRFTLVRTNRYASDGGLSWIASQELTDAVGQLLRNPFETVRVTTIDYRATASTPYHSYRIDPAGLEIAVGTGSFQAVTGIPVELQPGAQVRLRVPLTAYRGAAHTVEVRMSVPATASGFGDLIVAGGVDLAGEECATGDCAVSASGFDDLLAGIRARPRGDDLVLRLWLAGGEEPPAGAPALPDAEARQRLDEVVTGSTFVPVFVGGDAAAACGGQGVAPFVDVAPQSTHGPAIACSTALGLVEGVAQNPRRYDPGAPVRRDQAAAVLLRALDHLGAEIPPAPASPRFDDLAGNVHADAIERLAAAGILQGRTGGRYEPQAAIRRDQLAALLAAALDHADGRTLQPVGPAPYPDVTGVHADAVALATERGLLAGTADGRFRPADGTRRDQLASVVVRLLRQFGAA